MWRTPWFWSTAALTVVVAVMARRLSNVQVQLERARAHGPAGETPGSGTRHSVDGQPPWAASEPSEMAAEWEQVRPPMDS
jgi:hypothetical protein